ncbi:MAG: glycoside hydrolase, partial [Calditrichaceae bacterium]
LLQKFLAETFTVSTKIDMHLRKPGSQAGLIVMGLDYACIRILQQDDNYYLEYAICIGAEDNKEEISTEKVLINQKQIFLQVKIDKEAICHFKYSFSGNDFIEIGKAFKAREGKWIGAKVGLYCLASNDSEKQNYVDVDWFRITK